MAEITGISWCDSTFNPWIGCTKVSPACDFCYAERENERFHWVSAFGHGIPRHRTKDGWRKVRNWQKEAGDFRLQHGRRRRLFCASLADVFDNEVPDEWRMDPETGLWRLVRDTPDIIWMILTKRIGNASRMLPKDWGAGYENVMLMSTISSQREADRDVPKLLALNARWRALSVEPMLGRVNLERVYCSNGDYLNALTGEITDATSGCVVDSAETAALDLVIGGGESMKAGMEGMARAVHPAWARDLRDQCARNDVAFHWKQWGEWSDKTMPQRPHLDARARHTFDDGTSVALLGCDKTGRSIDGREHDGWPETAL